MALHLGAPSGPVHREGVVQVRMSRRELAHLDLNLSHGTKGVGCSRGGEGGSRGQNAGRDACSGHRLLQGAAARASQARAHGQGCILRAWRRAPAHQGGGRTCARGVPPLEHCRVQLCIVGPRLLQPPLHDRLPRPHLHPHHRAALLCPPHGPARRLRRGVHEPALLLRRPQEPERLRRRTASGAQCCRGERLR